jgi:cytochrome P450
MNATPAVERSIPQHLVVDFDAFRPAEPGSDPFLVLQKLQQGPEIVWTPHNGGHWIATHGETVKAIIDDPVRFSSSSILIATPNRDPLVPAEYDPPLHGPLRKPLMLAFLPKHVKRWTLEAQDLAVKLIEGLKPHGGCEFMSEFAAHLPVIVFLRIVALPLEDREKLVTWVKQVLQRSDLAALATAHQNINQYIDALTDERLAHPGDDLFSQAISADIGGRPMTLTEARGLGRTVLLAGLDTVAALLGWTARYLAQNPAARRRILDEPRIIPRVIEEMLRRYSVANIARVVREDMEYRGVQMRAGEQIYLPTCMHGIDKEIFSDPLNVDFDRPDSHKHLGLGSGIHRCVGAPLAHAEMKIFLEEWLTRIPEFSLDPDNPPIRVTGIVHSHETLHLIWPKAPTGA